MRFSLASVLILASVASAAAADAYDAIYVSDPAVCERAGERPIGNVLFDLHATAVAPRSTMWVGGEMECKLVDQRTHLSPIAADDSEVEIFATARCYAAYSDFIDQVVLTTVSQSINADNGDADVVPDRLEVMSMRADMGGEAQQALDGYDGLYTRCDALKAEDFAWEE